MEPKKAPKWASGAGMEAGQESRFNVHNEVAKKVAKTMGRMFITVRTTVWAGLKTDIVHNI